MIVVSIDLSLFTKANYIIRNLANNSNTLNLCFVIKFLVEITLFTCGNSDLFTMIAVVKTSNKNRNYVIKIEEEIADHLAHFYCRPYTSKSRP